MSDRYPHEDDPTSTTPLFTETSRHSPDTVIPPVSSYQTPADGDDTASSAAKEKAGQAADEAKNVAGDAQDAASHVAGVTKDQVGAVAAEVKSQAKDLYSQATSELKEQAGTQSQKAAEGLRSVSDELKSMALKSDGNGLASELVQNLSGRAGSAASWLDGRDPGTLLDDVKHFAARKPGTFIAIAAGAGLLAGRLAKALAADAKSDSSSPASVQPVGAPADSVQAPLYPAATDADIIPAAPSAFGENPDDRSFDDIVGGGPTTEAGYERPGTGYQS